MENTSRTIPSQQIQAKGVAPFDKEPTSLKIVFTLTLNEEKKAVMEPIKYQDKPKAISSIKIDNKNDELLFLFSGRKDQKERRLKSLLCQAKK